MGADFLEKIKKSYVKHIDAKRVALATADLFTRVPQDQARCALAKLMQGAYLAQGDKVIVERDGEGLVASRGLTVVARFINPPQVLLAAVEASCGVATGEIIRVNSISNTVEVAIC